MTISEQLLESGYKKHVSEHYRLLKMTDTLYQKRVDDSYGVKYYVNAWYYPERMMPNTAICPEGVMFETQYRDGDDYITVELSTSDIDKAEEEFYKIWQLMGYGYKKRWDED